MTTGQDPPGALFEAPGRPKRLSGRVVKATPAMTFPNFHNPGMLAHAFPSGLTIETPSAQPVSVVFCMVCRRVRLPGGRFEEMPLLLAAAGEDASSTLCPACAESHYAISSDEYRRCCAA